MYYKKIELERKKIEFFNNWLGEEFIYVNGQLVSKKFSIMGIDHPFELMENGITANYIVTTKVDMNWQVSIDIKRNGKLVRQNVPVGFGSMPKKPKKSAKEKGIQLLDDYDLEKALEQFHLAIDSGTIDSEVYFYMACIYSIMEREEKGFIALQKAVGYQLANQNRILEEDHLAYLRMHPAFDEFRKSGFTKINQEVLENAVVERLIEEVL